MKKILLLSCLTYFLSSTPIKKIPDELLNDFTLNGKIPVLNWYLDGTYASNKPIIWTTKEIRENLTKIRAKRTNYYGKTDSYLYAALKEFQYCIKNKKVAVVGSITPWYESIILHYGGTPTTIEYNTINCEDSRIRVFTVEEFKNNPETFDAVLSISSIEHDGLGRYGDPINPYGDFEAMSWMKNMLKPDGVLFLAVPVCSDSVMFNAHRTYGKIRLPMLLSEWEILNSYGFSEKDFKKDPKSHFGHQPVFVLKANN